MKYSSSKAINKLVQDIVDLVNPIRIVIFGSAARGKTNPESDIDLLVIMPEGTHRRHTAQLIYSKISGIGIPFDIVVATTQDLKKYKDNIGLIYNAILKEGREIYAA